MLHELPARFADLAREVKVRRKLAEERRLAEQARQAEVHRKAEVRRRALERLSAVEKEADRWARAERLRAFVQAFEAAGELDAEQRAFSSWTLNAADWLDPLLRGHARSKTGVGAANTSTTAAARASGPSMLRPFIRLADPAWSRSISTVWRELRGADAFIAPPR
jgi:hypothetical protein